MAQLAAGPVPVFTLQVATGPFGDRGRVDFQLAQQFGQLCSLIVVRPGPSGAVPGVSGSPGMPYARSHARRFAVHAEDYAPPRPGMVGCGRDEVAGSVGVEQAKPCYSAGASDHTKRVPAETMMLVSAGSGALPTRKDRRLAPSASRRPSGSRSFRSRVPRRRTLRPRHRGS